jgi:hypothetical protein
MKEAPPTVARCVRAIARLLRDEHGQLRATLHTHQSARADVPRLLPTTPDALRTAALADFRARLSQAQAQCDRVAAEPWLRRWPARWAANTALRAAQQACAQAECRADQPDQVAARLAATRVHNAGVQAQDAERARLGAQIAQLVARAEAIDAAYHALQHLHGLAKRGAWFAPEAIATLDDLHRALQGQHHGPTEARAPVALQGVHTLPCQQLPSAEELARWAEHTTALWQPSGLQGGVGYLAMAAYPGVAQPTLTLLLQLGTAAVAQAVTQDPAVADQWRQLAPALAPVASFRCDVHWALYWGAFKASQRFAQEMAQAAFQEEHATGLLAARLRDAMVEWSGPYIAALGYPRAKAAFGTYSLGATAGEALTGADLGVVVDIRIGPLAVRKVALLQAKTSRNGQADVGSESSGPMRLTQLQKLRHPQRDHYLFYHRGERHVPTLMPTVVPAATLRQHAGWTEEDLAKRHLQIADARTVGWELASFFVGMTSAEAAAGLALAPDDDPMEALGGHAQLPRYLVMVTVADNEHDHALRHEWTARYRALGHPLGPRQSGPSGRSLEREGPSR